MRRGIIFVLLTVAVFCSCGTNQDKEKEVINNDIIATAEVVSEEKEVVSEAEFSWDNATIFRYGDKEYDLQEIEQGVNAIKWCEKVGKYIVIEGHVGPHNGHYFIFDTETKEFEKIISGAGLTWHSDDVTTSVYTFWDEIYTYDGELVAKCEIDQFDIIRSITFIEDNTKIEVEISPNYGEEYTIEFTLPEE